MSEVYISKKTLAGLQELADLSPKEFPSLTVRDAISLTLSKEANDLLVKQMKKGGVRKGHKSLKSKTNPWLSTATNVKLANRIESSDQIRRKSGSEVPRIER